MLTDDDLDTRLRAAGERFRARASEPARAISPRRTRRRRTPLLVAAAAAVVVGLVVAITQLTGRSVPHGGAAPGHAMSITGVHWRLTAAADAKGDPVPVTGQVGLFIDNATLTANDGCNAIGGPVQLRGNELRFGNLISTAMGCLDAGEQVRVVDAVLRDTVRFAITGGTLILTKPGTGSLTYTARGTTAAPDPKLLAGPRWRLTGIGENSAGSASSRSPVSTYVLTFDSAGHYTLSDRCNVYGGDVRVSGADLVFSGRHVIEAYSCPAIADVRAERSYQQQGAAIDSVLTRATWTLDDNGALLTLSTIDTTLTFRG